ncbi:MAG: diguanylate cyclase [Rhodocyclaceae bacterium]|nr:diguanylate cyclase [Rhodocyclaceae bacterium]
MNFWTSLTGRLFKLVFGWYLALAIAVTSVQLALEYSSINHGINNDLESLGRSFAPSLSDALWAFDQLQLSVMAQGIVQTSYVTGVRIESADGYALATAGELPPINDIAGTGLLAPYQRKHFPLEVTTPRGERKQIGEFVLYSDRSVALERIKYSFMVILINSLIKTAGLWLIFYLVITRSLARPLADLTRVVSRVEFAADTVEPIALDYKHQDELGRLLATMHKMQERVIAAHQQVLETNRHLEETVAQRTEALRASEQRLTLALAAANEAWWDWDLASGNTLLSPSYHTMLGYAEGELPSTYAAWRKLVHPDDLVVVEARQHQVLMVDRSDSVAALLRMRAKDGSWRWISSHATVVSRDGDGNPLRVIGTNLDVTRQHEAEEKLRLAATVFEHAHEGICITDAQERILNVNPTFLELSGYSLDEVIGKTPRLLKSGHQSPEFYAAMWQAIRNNGYWQGEVWNRHHGGQLYAERLTISAVRDHEGRVTHYVGVLSDITTAKRYAEKLERIAHYDVLTGIPNRALLADRMGQAIAQTNRNRSLLAVCYLDLDGFKPVNDRFGHEAGDRLLMEIARRLRDCLRGGDTVARLGGDEFVLLFTGLASEDECRTALTRVLESINTPVSLDGQEATVSASIGVALYPRDDSDPDALLRHADQAMYLAKQEGKNRYHFAEV